MYTQMGVTYQGEGGGLYTEEGTLEGSSCMKKGESTYGVTQRGDKYKGETKGYVKGRVYMKEHAGI